MKHVQQQYLELLRAGLWNRPADQSLFQSEVDWKAITRTSHQQTTDIIVADGIDTLPPSLCPTKNDIFKLAIRRTENTLMHKLLNTTLKRVVQALNTEGIRSILLKGHGVALNYLRPQSRMCGDIDLYVGEKNFERACQVLKKEGATSSHDYNDQAFHVALDLDGAEIEVHRKADRLNNRRLNKSLQQWTIDKLDSRLAAGTLPGWDNDGVLINLPDPTYNAFYIIHHAVRHLIGEGIGLRHVCDWAMYMHTHHSQIDKEELMSRLIEYNMLEAWKTFGNIAVHALGLPAEELPFMSDTQLTPKAEILLQHIFYTGNFGRHSEEKRDSKSNYIKRKWHNFWFQMSRLHKIHKIFPQYARAFGWGWLTGALHRFITRK
jgi:hypothetical protein